MSLLTLDGLQCLLVGFVNGTLDLLLSQLSIGVSRPLRVCVGVWVCVCVGGGMWGIVVFFTCIAIVPRNECITESSNSVCHHVGSLGLLRFST